MQIKCVPQNCLQVLQNFKQLKQHSHKNVVTIGEISCSEALHAKLFRDAIEVTVSQSPNLEKIQKEIAERLDIVFYKDCYRERALELRHRRKNEEKFLIIIDNVWKQLGLLDIGVAFEDHLKGCKIVLASRSQDVLRDEMDVKNNFEFALLSKSEAWTCFWNIIGDGSLSVHNNHEFGIGCRLCWIN
ncbi:hypothetical protein FNV43_RR02566 [Rhamnella rubrinervis]|uniref:NB-ARC domain-containing protein n=1 Tax=Rhamnella rubrinervis TaxID=2594499 RepID=A0A8K0HRQ0_9ROSA|nr:hypothetical protein FNV43_RR02566 [Rhamnella rubrinervis]